MKRPPGSSMSHIARMGALLLSTEWRLLPRRRIELKIEKCESYEG